MKKIQILMLSLLLISGCSKKEPTENTISVPKETEQTSNVIQNIRRAEFDNNGNIVINKADITTNATYIDYEYDGVDIGLLAVRDSKDNVKVVVNTCQACNGSPLAYFVQAGKRIQCQNCKNSFNISDLDNLVEYGCNPLVIENKIETEDTITIEVEQLQLLKSNFENWQGQKI